MFLSGMKSSSHLRSSSKRFFSSVREKKKSYLMSKGLGIFGALGHSNFEDSMHSFKVIRSIEAYEPAVISAGWGQSLVVTSCGKLFVFGRPYDFPMLLKIYSMYKYMPSFARWSCSLTSKYVGDSPQETGCFLEPTIIDGVGIVKTAVASAGLTAGLTEDGDIFCFGLNRWGQCGIAQGKDKYVFQEPQFIPTLPKMKMLDVGLQHVLALSESGRVFAWGKGAKGQLGIDFKEAENKQNDFCSTFPVPVQLPNASISVAAGFNSSAALTVDGDVFVWGYSMSSEVKTTGLAAVKGVSIFSNQFSPRKLHIPSSRKAVKICCSKFNLVVQTDDGLLWAMGMGEDNCSTSSELVPVLQHFPLYADQNVEQLKLDLETKLLKGFHRVFFTDSNRYPFEVVYDDSRAFAVEYSDGEKENVEIMIDNKEMRIDHISTGWQHAIAIVSE